MGNWAAYTAGANTDSTGNTFVKIGWNPVYMESNVLFRKTRPDYGIEIECEGGNCNGLPCKIDPAVNDVNEVSGSSTDDVGTGGFCVVTVPKGETARIVIFDGSGGSGGSSDDDEEESTSTAEPTSTSTSTSSSTTSSSTTEAPTSTSTVTSSSSSSSTTHAATSSTELISSSTQQAPSGSSSSGWPGYTYSPHVFVETGARAAPASSTSAAEEETPSPTSGAQKNSQNAMIALLAVVAMAAFTF